MHSSGRELRVKPPNRQCGRPCPCVVGESTTVILACLLALVCIGCASIESFRASPRRACVGDAVTVTWAATGDVVPGTDPALPVAGPKASSESSSSHPADHRLTLHVHRGFSSETVEVDVVITPQAGSLAASRLALRRST